MMKKITYLLSVVTAFVLLALSGCSGDDDGPTTNVPPQTTESKSVSINLSLDLLTRASGAAASSGQIKTQWEEGDKVYFNYTKTFADDQEIINVFTVSSIDNNDSGNAVCTCVAFVMPRGVEEGQLVYIGKKEVSTLADLSASSLSLGNQTQTGNNDLSHIGEYLHMASAYFQASSPEEVEEVTPTLKHSYSLVTLQIKCPEGWTGEGLSEIELSLDSDNVTLVGTTDNKIVLSLENATWVDGRLTVHFIVNMSGRINDGNEWTTNIKETGTDNQFSMTYAAKSWENGKHYTSIISDDPSDYETPIYTEVPGFEEAGEAF